MTYLVPIVIAAALFLAGCEKKEEAPPDVPAQPSAQQENAPPPATPTPPLPEPDRPKEPTPPTPLPGQANDHSNPAFQEGGKKDPAN
ncbi:hypothetical protein [Aromatoleum aromaticum]|uniref:hypothetical protein n=1 Tax=Aromatoleum aromaticum TaxID=551760 RepID=UPI0006747A6C|nr:hypothetical protein [Aromatoleum aromaticum]